MGVIRKETVVKIFDAIGACSCDVYFIGCRRMQLCTQPTGLSGLVWVYRPNDNFENALLLQTWNMTYCT